jgi:hypothetical protein
MPIRAYVSFHAINTKNSSCCRLYGGQQTDCLKWLVAIRIPASWNKSSRNGKGPSPYVCLAVHNCDRIYRVPDFDKDPKRTNLPRKKKTTSRPAVPSTAKSTDKTRRTTLLIARSLGPRLWRQILRRSLSRRTRLGIVIRTSLPTSPRTTWRVHREDC